MPKRTDIKTILLIGSGPIVIGQACEFDYSGTQACKALREEGYRVVLVNSNPATIMTDPETADRTYIEPITWQVVEKIIEKEKPDALLPVAVGEERADLRSEDALERHGRDVHDDHFDAECVCGRGDLGADEAGTDDDETAPRAEGCAERVRVRGRTEDVDALELGEGEGARAGTGGDHECVPLEALAGRPAQEVDGFDPCAEHELDVLIGPELLRAKLDPVLKGERWYVVLLGARKMGHQRVKIDESEGLVTFEVDTVLDVGDGNRDVSTVRGSFSPDAKVQKVETEQVKQNKTEKWTFRASVQVDAGKVRVRRAPRLSGG